MIDRSLQPSLTSPILIPRTRKPAPVPSLRCWHRRFHRSIQLLADCPRSGPDPSVRPRRRHSVRVPPVPPLGSLVLVVDNWGLVARCCYARLRLDIQLGCLAAAAGDSGIFLLWRFVANAREPLGPTVEDVVRWQIPNRADGILGSQVQRWLGTRRWPWCASR